MKCVLYNGPKCSPSYDNDAFRISKTEPDYYAYKIIFGYASSFCFISYSLLDIKVMEEMKGADQEYSSTVTQYNSSANSGGEDIELLAFQTVTG